MKVKPQGKSSSKPTSMLSYQTAVICLDDMFTAQCGKQMLFPIEIIESCGLYLYMTLPHINKYDSKIE